MVSLRSWRNLVWHVAVCGVLCCAAGAALAADFLTQSEAATLLKKVSQAARVSSYSGIYHYQSTTDSQTFRLVHVFDAVGEQERREALDGPQREFVRVNDQVTCYIPGVRPLSLDRRTANKFFPGIMPDQIADVLSNYAFRRLGVERVAGRECEAILLEPRDRLRNPHSLCVEPNSALLLRSTMYTPDLQQILEQFAFTQLEIGAAIDRRELRPVMASRAAPLPPQRPDAGLAPLEVNYELRNLPSGFRLVKETTVRMPGRSQPVQQLLFSDGLATVSVFIEASEASPAPVAAQRGTVSVYTRQVGNWRITALGEVPVATVQLLSQSLDLR
jgi:sigma-E factor negative regulatory protein RseB